MATPAPATAGRVQINVFDGTRNLYSGDKPVFLTVIDGNQKTHYRQFSDDASLIVTDLPMFHNSGDNYTVLASAAKYKDGGYFPVKIAEGTKPVVDLMILPKSDAFNFAQSKWNLLAGVKPAWQSLYADGAASPDAAATRYSNLEDGGPVLACLLNITTALEQINLPQLTALQYFKRLIWDTSGPNTMAQDRFYAWADPKLIDQVKQAATQANPTFTPVSASLHPGATLSFKEIRFGEANVQLTFHENDRLMVGGVNCVLVEPDIDYFKDLAAHLFLEVLLNAFGGLTDPRAVYALRWIAGRRAGLPEFDPLYTIQAA